MAYIGNGRTLLILGSNVRDDIVPDNTNTTFTLTQEVPGGYEGNIYAFRQIWVNEKIIASNTNGDVKIVNAGASTFQIQTTVAAIAAAISDIKESKKTFTDSDHRLTISGSATTANNGTFVITNCTYNGTTATITLNGTGAQVNDSASQLTLTHGYSGFWEVLEPEVDYTIGGTGSVLNRQITFNKIPRTDDKIYVIHKGDATYNLVPSDNSVGPNQLSQNLREFSKQIVGSESPATTPANVVNGTNTEFVLTQNSINSKAILVSVNGLIQEGEEWNGTSVTTASDYALRTDLNPNRIRFRVAPASGARVRVLHLGFSTVSRRASLSPGQVSGVPNDSVGSAQLQNGSVTTDKIVNGAVTNAKIADDSVTSNKILLLNNSSIRSFLSNGTTVQNILSVGSDNVTSVNASSQVSIAISGTKSLNITTSEISSETTGTQSLGSFTKQFTNLHLSGTANAQSANISGNITVGGTVDGVDISAFQTSVNSQISNLNSLIDTFIPIGTIVPYSGAASSGVLVNSRWLICDGTSVSRTIYPTLNALYSSQSYPFGNGDGFTTFTLPDLQRRVPIGRRDIDSIGANDGLTLANRTFNHTHTIPAHSHGMAHTHNLPGHYHVHDTAVGSNLNITNSGTHQTTIDINHTHGTFYASNVTLQTELKVTGVSLTDPGHTHNYDAAANTYHGNGITRTASVEESGLAASHSHTGTTSTDGDHTHSLREESGGSTSRANTININASTVGTTSTQTRNIVSAGSHSHTFTTAGANTNHWHYIRPATTGCQVADPVGVTDYDGLTRSGHRHNVRCTTPATNPNGGAAWNVGEHNHSVNITALGVTNRSDLTTSGGHTHGTNAFAGNIGNLNSTINGNVTGGTNITQSQSVSATSDSAILTSGNPSTGVNTPYLTVNYIIRVL